MAEDKWQFGAGPSPEVIEYFEGKGLKPSFDWRDVWAEEHAIAFTVAKTTGFDVLEDIHEELRRALKEGLPFAEFRKRLEPKLKAKGWWGRREVIDPASGEVVDAQLGSRRRLKVIYEANMRTARAAGQWARAQRTKRMLPYFEYRLGPSKEHRAHHAAWAARPTILPVDDPWWDSHYPPNGWGCKCWLRQISRREAERKGGPVRSPAIEYRNWINRRTGEVERIPVGIDPGWHSNPGKARAAATLARLTEKMRERPSLRDYARQVMREFWRHRIWEAFLKTARRVQMPVALLPFAQDVLGGNDEMVAVANKTVAAKSARRHAHVPAREWDELLTRLPEVLEAARPQYEVHEKWGPQVVLIVKVGRLWRIVVRKSAAGFLYVATIHPTGPSKIDRHKKK